METVQERLIAAQKHLRKAQRSGLPLKVREHVSQALQFITGARACLGVPSLEEMKAAVGRQQREFQARMQKS